MKQLLVLATILSSVSSFGMSHLGNVSAAKANLATCIEEGVLMNSRFTCTHAILDARDLNISEREIKTELKKNFRAPLEDGESVGGVVEARVVEMIQIANEF